MSTEESFSQGSARAIISFLKSNVPKSNIENVEGDLKANFGLAKKRSSTKIRKPKKKKVRCLTRIQKKALGFYNIPKDSLRYIDILPLNKLWTDYICEVLEIKDSIPERNSKNWESFTQTFYKADLHGAYMRVVESKCPSYVFKKGICIMDTKNTFKILSEENIVTTLPKKECVFEISLKDWKLTLFGKHFCSKPADRSNKKMKNYLYPEL
ncbi:ribonuclease P protein subunit p29 [Manduca sexta]|uniref:Ribonuclease P protein subunit p29 n=1 Tax=Manduca sexta TaxID=7130 RepID=A0A921ZKP4_MANSE|nr:ribonuclease P protein subunit p29 [Manduca sexta]KAG6459541.1 hypothetical protein O3G_MSEX011428 [Manduca sexta]